MATQTEKLNDIILAVVKFAQDCVNKMNNENITKEEDSSATRGLVLSILACHTIYLATHQSPFGEEDHMKMDALFYVDAFLREPFIFTENKDSNYQDPQGTELDKCFEQRLWIDEVSNLETVIERARDLILNSTTHLDLTINRGLSAKILNLAMRHFNLWLQDSTGKSFSLYETTLNVIHSNLMDQIIDKIDKVGTTEDGLSRTANSFSMMLNNQNMTIH